MSYIHASHGANLPLKTSEDDCKFKKGVLKKGVLCSRHVAFLGDERSCAKGFLAKHLQPFDP